jgi:hypothetical protein
VLELDLNPASRKGWGTFWSCVQKQELDKPHSRLGYGVEAKSNQEPTRKVNGLLETGGLFL